MQENNQSAIAIAPSLDILAPLGERGDGLAMIVVWLPKDTPADIRDAVEVSMEESYSRISDIVSGRSSED